MRARVIGGCPGRNGPRRRSSKSKVKVRLLPLNPAREADSDGNPGSRNWELHRQFCEENPRLSHFNYRWLVATTRARQGPRWHQFNLRDGQDAGEELPAVHGEVLRMVILERGRGTSSPALTGTSEVSLLPL